MQGVITEKNWKEIDRVFDGVHSFYRHLSHKPRTFLELLELYHSFDDAQPATRRRKSMRRCAILILLLAALFAAPHAARAQAETAPAETAPMGAPVGASVEESALRTTLKLMDAKCDINQIESVLLRMKGVSGVDVESKKGHLVVDYDSKIATPQQMVDALARKKGCFAREAK